MKIRKQYSLIITIAFCLGCIILLNWLLLYFEKNQANSSIDSFPDAVWYMVVTLTTVGYGDAYPISPEGKMIGYLYVFGSLGILGFLISTLSNKYRKLMEEKRLGYKGTSFENHIILIGWNEFSKLVADEIYHTAKQFAIITNVKDDIELIYNQYDSDNVFVLFSDYDNYEGWDLVNAEKASTVFISLKNDSDALLYVIDFKKRYPHTEIVVSLEKSRLKQTFQAAGVTYAIARNEIASKLVASYIFEPDVANLNNDLLSASRSASDFDIQEYLINEQNALSGYDYFDAFVAMKEKHDVVLLGISRQEGGSWKLLTNPSKGTTIQAGDYLLLMCNGQTKKQIENDFGVEEGRVR